MLSEFTLSRQPENIQGAVFGTRRATTFWREASAAVGRIGPRGRREKSSGGAYVSAQERAYAAPAGVVEEVGDEIERGGGVAVARVLVVRPDDEHRAADDEVARHGPPDAAVGAVVPVIAHHEVVAFGDFEGLADRVPESREGVGRAAVPLRERLGPVVDGVGLARARGRGCEFLKLRLVVAELPVARLDAVFGQRAAVDVDVRPLDLNGLAGQPYDALDEEGLVLDDAVARAGLAGELEDDYVASADFALREEGDDGAGAEDELVDEEVVADVDRVLHRGGGDDGRLRDEGHEEESHDEDDGARLCVLAQQPARRRGRALTRAVAQGLVRVFGRHSSQGSEGLAAGEPGLDLVPPLQPVALAQLPAEQHHAPVAQAGEVYEPALVVFQLHAERFELARVLGQLRERRDIDRAADDAAAPEPRLLRGDL